MRHIKLPEHLILRKERYYFRYVFPRKFIGSDIRISLKTKHLHHALNFLELIKPELDKLKILASDRHNIDTETLITQAKRILIHMKQKLTHELSKKIIAKEEQRYASTAHSINGIKAKPLNNHSPRHLRTAANIMLSIADGETGELLVEALQNNDYEVLNIYVLASKYMALKNSGLSNADIVANKQIEKSVRQLARQLDTFLLAGMFNNSEVETDEDLFDDSDEDDNFYADNIDAIDTLNKHDVEFEHSSLEYSAFKSMLETSRNLQAKYLASCLTKDSEQKHLLDSMFNKSSHTIAESQPREEKQQTQGPLFSEVYAEFLDFKVKAGLSDRLVKEYARHYEAWCLLSEDKAIESYKASDIGRFIDRCYQLPKKNRAPYSKMSLQECLDFDVPEDDLVTPKTVQGYYKWLQGIFSYAKRDTVEYIQHSPCTIKRDFKQRIRGVFNSEELTKFEVFAMQTKHAWQKWSLLLAMYTGARRTEIYQLRKPDIRVEDGINYILVTDEHESQRLKTSNAKRKIPIHKRLIEFGFLEYVEQAQERILYEITSAESITSWFGRLVVELEIPSVNELDELRSYHSFRHTFISNIRNNHAFDLSLIQQIVGHELSKGGITDKYTHGGASLTRLDDVVNAFFLS
ncbi:DUF3258 domain-containing protein [Pseudoalteromonas sp. Angola-7]|uniref:DUF3258 domain-containing protein n=1 Tax=Pseudoalteromonas sp. Angola-7 TaxID=3025336 RepID=UPI002359E01F|nr:DUF3258 domain-containing protein [Pseudoalteromonas sp. Angola-7]MDC9529178.1 DUF3258 domain-containing protein [Pseudoalteromonas sp. Angola-7]